MRTDTQVFILHGNFMHFVKEYLLTDWVYSLFLATYFKCKIIAASFPKPSQHSTAISLTVTAPPLSAHEAIGTNYTTLRWNLSDGQDMNSPAE
jgi:hypothetical protein